MRFDQLTAEEVQKIYFELKNQKAMQAYFGDAYATVVAPLLKSGAVLRPTDLVSKLTSAEFLRQLALFDGSRAMARHYGVSVAYIRNLWKKHTTPTTPPVLMTPEALVEALTQYGSVRMVCRLKGIKESDLRKIAKAAKLELAPYLNFEFGNYEVNRGRRGELYWKGQRGALVTKDMNEAESSQSDYDFEDTEFGTVNVKSSKRYRYKAKCRRHSPYYWTFSCSGLEKCKHIVFVLYDAAFENAIGWGVVPSENLVQLGTATFTIRSDGLGQSSLSNGQIIQFVIE